MREWRLFTLALAGCLLIGMACSSALAGQARDSVTIACAAEPDCFFPYHTSLRTNMDEVPILHNVYETPIKFAVDGTHQPLLATSWDVSDGGRTYTLHIRDDVYFHNGRKMTAEDVAYSITLGGRLPDGGAQLANFVSATALDDTTVEIKLSAPYGPFLNALAGRYALVVDKELFEKIGVEGYNKAPVGTGPYTFVSRASGSKIVLKANEKYWNGKPSIDAVNYQIMTDANTQIISLENNDIDVLIQANVGALTRVDENRVKWLSTEASSLCNMEFNLNKGPGKDLNFRKALQAGINKEEINIGVYEGHGTVADIQMCPSFSGRPDNGTFKVVSYDPEQAKKHLAESSYNGEEFTIITVAGTRNETAAQIIQGQLIELGVNCTVNAVDAPSFDALRLNEGSYGANIRAGGVSVLDADGLFYQYHSAYRLQPGLYDAGVCSPEMDELLTRGRTEPDPEKRKEIYAQVNDLIVDNALGVCLFYEVNACAFNPALKGIAPRALTGLYFYNDWNW